MPGSALDLENVQDERGDVPKVSQLESVRRCVSHCEAECRIEGVTRVHVFDVAVVAGDEQENRGVQRVEQTTQEVIDPLQRFDRACHSASVTGRVGRVVGVERQVMITRNAGQIGPGLSWGDVG